ASCLRPVISGWLGFLPLQLSTTHTPASAFPTPSRVRHKRNRTRSVAVTAATGQTMPASHWYSGVVPVAHRHRVSLTRHVPRLPLVDAFVMVSLGFSAGPTCGMRGAVGQERYYVRMRPVWATSISRREIGRLCPPSPRPGRPRKPLRLT